MGKLLLLLMMMLILTGCAPEQPEEIMETTLPAETDASRTYEAPDLMTVLIEPKDTDFVRVKDYIPEIQVELKYTGTDNFTGQDIYDFEDAYLRYGTVMKLKAVSEELAGQGLTLKIWDAFRPVAAQYKLWEVCPDSTYVANPNEGFSNHSRGFAVDVTLVDSEGRELEMPTAFDDFTAKADRDYSDCTAEAAGNAQLLESIMEKHGFSGYWGEWWHFSDTVSYDVETCFDPAVISLRKMGESTDLLPTFREKWSKILTIPAGESVTLLGYDEEYSLVEYWGYRGYVPTEALVAE